MKLSRQKSSKIFFSFPTAIASVFLAFLPEFVFAAPENFGELLQIFLSILGLALEFLYAIAILVFVWGMASFILNTNDETKRKEGRKWMLWSVIALFIGLSLWGIVAILTGSFGLSSLVIPQLPESPI